MTNVLSNIPIVRRFLEKKGVKDYFDLTAEEREVLRGWETTLSGKKLTDDDVKVFWEKTLEDVLTDLENPENSTSKDIFLKAQLGLIRKMRRFLDSPEVEKRLLSQQLESQVK